MDYFKEKLEALLAATPLYFKDISELLIPELPGIYCIFSGIEGKTLYVGKTKNIRERILDSHLSGSLMGNRILSYTKAKNISYTKKDLMGFLIEYCFVRWLIETDYKKQDILESYISGILYTKNFPL